MCKLNIVTDPRHRPLDQRQRRSQGAGQGGTRAEGGQPFGEHEWSVRLGALIPSFLSLLLVAGIAWRWLGPVAGATAALMFAIVPVNVWYSVNIDQGFPSIATG